jgi:hypothetical protein
MAETNEQPEFMEGFKAENVAKAAAFVGGGAKVPLPSIGQPPIAVSLTGNPVKVEGEQWEKGYIYFTPCIWQSLQASLMTPDSLRFALGVILERRQVETLEGIDVLVYAEPATINGKKAKVYRAQEATGTHQSPLPGAESPAAAKDEGEDEGAAAAEEEAAAEGEEKPTVKE